MPSANTIVTADFEASGSTGSTGSTGGGGGEGGTRWDGAFWFGNDINSEGQYTGDEASGVYQPATLFSITDASIGYKQDLQIGDFSPDESEITYVLARCELKPSPIFTAPTRFLESNNDLANLRAAGFRPCYPDSDYQMSEPIRSSCNTYKTFYHSIQSEDNLQYVEMNRGYCPVFKHPALDYTWAAFPTNGGDFYECTPNSSEVDVFFCSGDVPTNYVGMLTIYDETPVIWMDGGVIADQENANWRTFPTLHYADGITDLSGVGWSTSGIPFSGNTNQQIYSCGSRTLRLLSQINIFRSRHSIFPITYENYNGTPAIGFELGLEQIQYYLGWEGFRFFLFEHKDGGIRGGVWQDHFGNKQKFWCIDNTQGSVQLVFTGEEGTPMADGSFTRGGCLDIDINDMILDINEGNADGWSLYATIFNGDNDQDDDSYAGDEMVSTAFRIDFSGDFRCHLFHPIWCHSKDKIRCG